MVDDVYCGSMSQGTEDRYIQEIERSTGLTLDEICDRVFDSPKWRRVVVEGMGHNAPLDQDLVRRELDLFLGIES